MFDRNKTAYVISAVLALMGACGLDPTAAALIAAGVNLAASAFCGSWRRQTQVTEK